jgi:hypothetical protein
MLKKRRNESSVWNDTQCLGSIVVIASAYKTEDPWFESRQGVKFLGIIKHCIAIVIDCVYLRKINSFKNTFSRLEDHIHLRGKGIKCS